MPPDSPECCLPGLQAGERFGYPVGWEVHDEETGELAADLLQRSVLAQRCAMQPLVLHSDNGAPMKSYTLKAKMEALAITSSFSRPRVSNDNPFYVAPKYMLRCSRKAKETAPALVLPAHKFSS